MTIRTDRYFAAAPKEEIGEHLINRIVKETQAKTGLANMYATAYSHRYGFEMGRGVTTEITRGGKQQELAQIRINKAASIGKSLLSLITGPQITWRMQASSNSANVKASTILGHNLMESYWKKRFMAQVCATKAESGISFAEGFVFSPWDETIGPERGIEAGKMVREGDVAFYNVLPWNVVRDSDAKAYAELKWKCIRLWMNKWDLMASRPEDILGEPTEHKILSASKDDSCTSATPMLSTLRDESDLVPVWYFFHEPTPALPEGREVIMVSAKCVLRDRPLSYKRIPLSRFGLDDLLGTPFGYTPWWDTLAIQEVMDSVESSIITNQLVFGTQSVGVEQGTTTPTENAFGMKEYVFPQGGQPPKAIQLTSSPPEAFSHLKDLARDQQQLLNLNDVQRGQPDTAQMNAQAFMVLASKAVEQNAPGQKGWLASVSDLGTNVLQIVQERVTVPRKIQITGKTSKYLYTEQNFKGDDLKAVESVFVEIGNPLEQSAGGRYQLALMYQELGLLKNAEDVQQVLDTGRLEPAIQDMRDEAMHIASENEDLSNGKVPLVHGFHNHMAHGPKHAAVLFNPEAMRNPKVMNATVEHVHGHYIEQFMFSGPPPMPGEIRPPNYKPNPLDDPQYPIRIRMLLGQVPPQDMVPPPAPGATDGTGAPPPGMPPEVSPPGMNGAPPAAPGAPPAMPTPMGGQLPI